MDARFDYVVIGAGSAGCAVAARLSEDPGTRVLVLEAGGTDRSLNIKIPAAFAQQFRTKLDWEYSSGPEPGMYDRELYVPRGKVLGGSSSMNAMMYIRGRPTDFDAWRDAGCEGWGWDDVLPYFMRSEQNSRGASEFHGGDGPLHVTDQVDPRPLTRRFVAAAEAAGIPANPDVNSPEQDGVGMTQVLQRNGRRWSAADAYLRPAMERPNLTVKTGVEVTGIEILGGRASGVRLRDRRGRAARVGAAREVILCAGAIGSPQLLMLSGVGPAAHLAEHGIGVVADVPGVGQNLQDHPYNLLNYAATVNEDLADAEKPAALAQFLLRKSGPLTSNVGEGVAFIRTRQGLPAPDIEMIFGPTFFHSHGFDVFNGNAFAIGCVLINPKARGELTLRSADPRDKPRLVGNHLTEPEDMAALVAGMRRLKDILAAEPLAPVVGRPLIPARELETDADIEDHLRRETELLYHPSGTCAMGTGPDAVLDPQLRVRGVESLRVADASVFPAIPGGHTYAPTMMVAEKAADLIRGG